MENFIVSARKYRPATFDSVVGQSHITTTLKNAIKSNLVAQAFLFTGPRGVGKTTCARIFAKTINCFNLTPNIEACNECESCLSFNKNASFNIHELDAASNNSVDDIRQLIEKVRFAPQVGKYSIYIIDEVHMLSNQAFNAFLKTLEEPPAHAKFILATTEKHKIIPTILSRCQIYDFRRITQEDIAQHLKKIAQNENIVASDEALHIIAQKADGGLRDALSIFDQLVSFANGNLTYELVAENLNVLNVEHYFNLTDTFLKGNYIESLRILDEILYKGYDAHQFIIGLGEHFRNLLIAKDKKNINLIEVSTSIRERYEQQAQLCTPSFLYNGLLLFNKFDVQYPTAKNKRLLAELFLLQLNALTPGVFETYKEPTLPTPEDKQGTPNPAKGTPNTVKENPTTYNTSTTKNSSTASALAKKENDNATTKPTKQDTSKGYIDTPSISQIKKNNTSTTNSAVATETETEVLTITQISQEDLEEYWMEYALSQKAENPLLHSTLTLNKPVLAENNVIKFNVITKVASLDLKEKTLEILSFLKEKSGCTFSLEVNVVTPTNQSFKPYTQTDKLKHLIQKNPLINELRKELELDFDY